ncbi:carbon-nitrogen hydrolase family protein [Altererythrobacter sp. SALINAS58]|uniref:carbon-nitrogen hydrolase family protein n=1 Tax=Alteripontixanthobacter muriae TaxID=2705546 RepID=UPI00157620F3|nr:carbon-nitrogen hydrolase family protein [Alteripontixanthobacter muriae]NTZ41631.1 carbon-nitrogen hydrolase family protein [Alteripontixanthobacter muriae]
MARVALLQMTSGINPNRNADTIASAVATAATGGAQMLFTPEMSGLLDQDRKRADQSIASQQEDAVLRDTREAARNYGIWVALGSLAVAVGEGRRANRAFVINPEGEVVCTYDKMHMFDVTLGEGDDWLESAAYAPGDRVAAIETPVGLLGLSICYDIRFPALYDVLGRAGCEAITIPAAFTVPTGRAHWHVLQRARAIESSAFVISAAQVGEHEDGRRTYGHSLVIDPWGRVLLDMGGTETGVGFAEVDLTIVEETRRKLPSLANRRDLAN